MSRKGSWSKGDVVKSRLLRHVRSPHDWGTSIQSCQPLWLLCQLSHPLRQTNISLQYTASVEKKKRRVTCGGCDVDCFMREYNNLQRDVNERTQGMISAVRSLGSRVNCSSAANLHHFVCRDPQTRNAHCSAAATGLASHALQRCVIVPLAVSKIAMQRENENEGSLKIAAQDPNP